MSNIRGVATHATPAAFTPMCRCMFNCVDIEDLLRRPTRKRKFLQ